MKVNINDIAKEAGVSHQTVSRIMNGRAHLHRPATVKKVLQAAKKLGYRVNAAAQAIRLGKTNSLALLHDWQPGRSSLPYSLLEGIEGALEQHDLLLTLNRYTDEQMSNPAFVPKILREVRSDGLLINFHTSPPSAMEELLEAYRIPSIWINIRRDHDTVNLNDFQAGYELTNTLIKRGHEHITYVCRGHEVTPRHYSKEERFAGYAKAMEEAGLEVSTLFHIPDLEAYEEYVRKHRHVSAYVCYGREYQSIGYYLMRNGVKIPEEVEFGIFAENNYSVYPGCVALAQLPFEEVGKTAVEILLQKIEHPERRFPEKRIPFPIYTGNRLRH